MDNRLETLKTWVGTVLAVAEYELRPASEDASFRRYFRVTSHGATYIVMDAPPAKEGLGPFIEIAHRLHQLGLNVPEVLEQDLGQGYLLLSDLGSQTYLPQLNESTVERLYGDALGALVVLQAGIFTDSSFLPKYDEALLRRELELFRFLDQKLNYNSDTLEEQRLEIDTNQQNFNFVVLMNWGSGLTILTTYSCTLVSEKTYVTFTARIKMMTQYIIQLVLNAKYFHKSLYVCDLLPILEWHG